MILQTTDSSFANILFLGLGCSFMLRQHSKCLISLRIKIFCPPAVGMQANTLTIRTSYKTT